MDDLRSGYNIVEILTLHSRFLNMLGFTYEEASAYLRYVFDKYGTGQDSFEELWQLIVNNYDGYRFRPGAGVRQDQREFHPLLLLRALFPLPEQLLYVRHRAEQFGGPFGFRDDRYPRYGLLQG